MTGRTTQGDVARRAGVHVSTVSLALRDHPSIPARTRTWLKVLAAEMGYRPDPVLSALVAYRSERRNPPAGRTLAYVTNWYTRWGWRELPAHAAFFAGASARASELGYRLDHFWLGDEQAGSRRLSDVLFARGIAGLLLASHRCGAEAPPDFDWDRFCAVRIDHFPRQPELPCVTNDQRGIIQLAVQRTRAAGYRRIGLVIPRWWDAWAGLAWSAGFLAEQQRLPPEARLPILAYAGEAGPAAEAWADGRVDRRVPCEELDAWLRRHDPEVVISWAPFVRPVLAALGRRVPRDLAYVDVFLGEDDAGTAGVRQNCRRVGAVAAEMLADSLQCNLRGLPADATATLVGGTWRDGPSLPALASRKSGYWRPGRRADGRRAAQGRAWPGPFPAPAGPR